jgi:predicted transcriptional regulator
MNDVAEIDARRAAAGITRKALYERAQVHKETWRRTIKGKTSPNTRTLVQLEKALAELVREKAAQ